jgi:hypothetical protein
MGILAIRAQDLIICVVVAHHKGHKNPFTFGGYCKSLLEMFQIFELKCNVRAFSDIDFQQTLLRHRLQQFIVVVVNFLQGNAHRTHFLGDGDRVACIIKE